MKALLLPLVLCSAVTAQLGTNVPAEVIIHPPASGVYNSGVILTCVAYGTPVPTITWQDSNGLILGGSNGVNVYNSQVTENSITFAHSNLEFCPFLVGQAGMYTCEAANSAGIHRVDFQVIRNPCDNYCMNGGTCTYDQQFQPSCACPTGFTGATCTTDLDFCSSTSCANSGTCMEGVGPLTSCTCPPGYTGPTCAIDMDFCNASSCSNGGTCVEGVGTLTSCVCQSGFTGPTCDTDLDFCTASSCSNGGTCVEGLGPMTSCTCQSGFTGPTCATDLDFCSSTSCVNGGTCVEGVGTLTSCNCQSGFTGPTCGTDLDFCSSTSCVNGGTCVEGVGTLTSCTCPTGFTGPTCATDIDFCNGSSCVNGGTCVEGVGPLTTCTCQSGFTGPTCATDLDFCTSTTCQNGGMCVEGIGDLTSCTCQSGFTGPVCATDLDFCTPMTCQNNGTCVEGIGTATTCDCEAGFSGLACETDLDFCFNRTCLNNGTCMEGLGTETSCSCQVGFAGDDCEMDLDYCTPTACNNGTCHEGVGTLTSCECQAGYSGVVCEQDLDYCTNMTCQNGASCYDGPGTETTCVCKPGFSGSLCERDLDFCMSDTCQHGGTCREGTGTIVTCVCSAGYSGGRCEVDENFCTPNHCSNGGMCIEGPGTATSCNCLRGFSGSACEEDLGGFCAPTTCMNDGTCEEGYGDSTICFCPPGFTGENCEADLNHCTASTCSNGGTCSEGRGLDTVCSCPTEYTGPTCLSLIEVPPVPCPAEVHSEWMLSYDETLPGIERTHPCSMVTTSASSTVTGIVRRLCLGEGVWGMVDVSGCREQAFVEISVEAQQTFRSSNVNPNQVEAVLESLQMATAVESPEDPSEFPQDLGTTNDILNMSLDFLRNDLNANPNDPLALSVRVVEIINNVLEPNNEPGWQSFSEVNRWRQGISSKCHADDSCSWDANEAGSQQLLNNAETYGQYFAQALMNPNVAIAEEINQTMAITRRNIVIQAQFVDPRNVGDIYYPPEIDPRKLSEFGSAQSILPASFLIQRGAREVTISAVNILMDNLRAYLPQNSTSSMQPVTSVISTQLIVPRNSSSNANSTSSKDATEPPTVATTEYRAEPAAFRFTTKNLDEGLIGENPTCAFWNFGKGVSQSSWSTEGVVTESKRQNPDKTYDVICRSTHLTSFAVLLDVNNALPEEESEILTFISYIGLSISIVCLVATIVFFIVITRKDLFVKVHYFIHLNLSIALLLGYVVFLAGVDTAVGNRIGCAFVAALLHYLFTAAFCWMLCEGIMLFLKLVVVFSKISQKWWFFFLIGWAPPLVIVAVSVGIIHNQYGTENYCWISAEDPKSGAIWAFALPMLVIILINFVFMGAVLYKLYQVKKSKLLQAKKYQSGKRERVLIKDLLIAVIILNPLLGGTWVFGLLSVSRETTFFAWIFTILNSLQGVFIFVFYVVKSEEVWGKFCSRSRSDASGGTLSTLGRRSKASVSNQGNSRHFSSQFSSTYASDYQGTSRKFSNQYTSDYYQGTGRKISTTSDYQGTSRKISTTSDYQGTGCKISTTSDYQGTGRKISMTSDYQGTGRKIPGQHSSTYTAPVKEKKEKGKAVQCHEDKEQLLDLELDMFSQS